MAATSTCVARKMTSNGSVRESINRFFLNRKVTVPILISLSLNKLAKILGVGEEILCIGGTTEVNYESKRNRIKDQGEMGYVGNGKDLGFMRHVTLLVGALSGRVYGVGDVFLWHRPYSAKPVDQKTFRISKAAIEEKES